jgi:hypothetical protein
VWASIPPRNARFESRRYFLFCRLEDAPDEVLSDLASRCAVVIADSRTMCSWTVFSVVAVMVMMVAIVFVQLRIVSARSVYLFCGMRLRRARGFSACIHFGSWTSVFIFDGSENGGGFSRVGHWVVSLLFCSHHHLCPTINTRKCGIYLSLSFVDFALLILNIFV